VPLKCLETYRLLLEFWVGRRVLGCLSEFHEQSLLVEYRRSEHARQRMDRAGIGAPRQSPAPITCRPGPKLRQISPHTDLK
jgi:hypothetical protein